MSGSDLIVEAPWIIFGAAVLAICIRLVRSRPARRQPEPGSPVVLRPGRLRWSRARAVRPGQSLSRPRRAAGT